MKICDKCLPDLSFDANYYKPEEFLEGRRDSLVWIIGLNPKKMDDEHYKFDMLRDKANLENYFSEPGRHPYFEDFKEVSNVLYDLLGKNKGVASTDIIKCFSESYPPSNCRGKRLNKIIQNCQPYLEQQLSEMKPKLIICNGADVCKAIKRIVIPIEDRVTSYIGLFGDTRIAVVLSGFIGRIDNYSKKRLGIEIERYMKELGII